MKLRDNYIPRNRRVTKDSEFKPDEDKRVNKFDELIKKSKENYKKRG